AITAAFILAALALWGTLHGYGPFVRANTNESLLLLQAFMGAMTITGLVLALLVADSRRAERRLQIQEAVSRILTEASTLKQAVPRILQAVCQEGAWDWAAIWAHDYGTQRLTCVGVWYDRPTRFASFEGATCQVTPEVSLSFAADVLKRGARSFMLDANT